MLHKKFFAGLIALCLLLFGSAGWIVNKKDRIMEVEDPHGDLKKSIDQILSAEMERDHIPGTAVAIVKDGKTVYKQGYGIANTATGQKVDADKTIFRIGSISKALTLLTLSRLIDQGRIGVEDDVSKYFDGIQNPHGFSQPVRIRHLLTHTSGFDQIGIGRHIYDFEQPLEKRKAQRPTISEFLRDNNLRRVTPAGQYYRYDTYGSTLAGAVIEQVTGLPFAEAMQKELFEPAGMSRSSVEVRPRYMEDLAAGHGFVDGAFALMPYEIYLTLPASSIDATAADMGRLL